MAEVQRTLCKFPKFPKRPPYSKDCQNFQKGLPYVPSSKKFPLMFSEILRIRSGNFLFFLVLEILKFCAI